MIPVNSVVDEIPARPDPESAEWIRVLAVAGPQQEAALARLHEMLLRIAQREARRRGPRLLIGGPELEDLAYQAAADALMAITGKLGQFRGESRFTTWACRFVILEVSAKVGRHFWRRPDVPLEAVALRLGSNRNAVYKMMFDARRKLRAALAANGYLDDDDSGRS